MTLFADNFIILFLGNRLAHQVGIFKSFIHNDIYINPHNIFLTIGLVVVVCVGESLGTLIDLSRVISIQGRLASKQFVHSSSVYCLLINVASHLEKTSWNAWSLACHPKGSDVFLCRCQLLCTPITIYEITLILAILQLPNGTETSNIFLFLNKNTFHEIYSADGLTSPNKQTNK